MKLLGDSNVPPTWRNTGFQGVPRGRDVIVLKKIIRVSLEDPVVGMGCILFQS